MADSNFKCGKGCVGGVTPDTCVSWTGPSIEALGIKKGMCLSEVLTNIANDFVKLTEGKVHLKCLYDGTCKSCDEHVSVPKAVEILIDWACSIKSGDITYEYNTACIGIDSVSIEGVDLMGRGLNIRSTVNGAVSTIYYDFSDAYKSIPNGYRVGSTNVIVRGSNSNNGSLLFNSSSTSSAIVLDTNKYPIYIDFDGSIVSPTGGTISLKNTLFMSSPKNSQEYVELDVKDYSSAPKSNALGKFVESIAAQVCSNKQCLSGYKSFSIKGCENLSVTNGDIKQVLAGLAGDVSKICKDVDDINNITFVGTGVCGGQNVTGLDNIFKSFNTNINSISEKQDKEIESMREVINSLQAQVSSLKNSNNSQISSTTTGLTSGGTCTSCGGTTITNTGGTTTCPNGQCPLNKG